MTPARRKHIIRRLYYGDNLPILRTMEAESADLIYLDPPFNSNRNYNAIFTNRRGGVRRDAKRQIRAFQDTWQWRTPQCEELLRDAAADSPAAGKMLAALIDALGKVPMTAYLVNMAARLTKLRRILKPAGSLYLHCDPTAGHYLKVMLDAIFGTKCFRNEIVWYYKNASRGKREFAHAHDSIFWYSRGGASWRFNRGDILQPFESGMTAWRHGQKGAPPPAGKTPDDVFIIPALNTMSNERVGYPTQKPLALLERIILASSAPGDLVLDPFCGCGTAPLAAEKLGRQWIGIDIAYRAVGILRNRFAAANGGALPAFEKNVEIFGEPKTAAEVREKTSSLEARNRKEFEVFCIMRLGGVPNETMGADGGVDGRIPLARYPGCYAIAQVKSGGAAIGDLRALAGLATKSDKEPVGVLILRECAAATLKKWRAEAHQYGDWNRIPRLQIVTLEDILRGDKPRGI